jgi:predicted transcriptional regulator
MISASGLHGPGLKKISRSELSRSEMKSKPIDINKIDLEKEKDKIADYPGLIAYAHNVGSAIIKPEDKGRIKGNAVAAMHDQTDRQFRQLFEQMQTLVQQAEYLKKRVEVSERIYQSTMGFQPVINQIYYLYQKNDQTDVLSMVSPTEWGKNMPYKNFEAKVRLLADHTWEIIESQADSFYD